MKTNKEYPATHSMSTTWFGVDLDGNVAVLEFEDNGPIPCQPFIEDARSSDILCELMATNARERFSQLQYTASQVDEIIKKTVPASEEFLNWPELNIIQIDTQKVDEFMQCMQKVFLDDHNYEYSNIYTLDKENGIYVLSDLYVDDEIVEQMVGDGIILRAYSPRTTLSVDCHTQKVTFENDIENFPFYVFIQEYWGVGYSSSNYHFRASIPKFPLKLEQMPEESQRKAIHIPLRFEECKKFAIDEFCKCYRYFQGEMVTVDGETGYELIRLTNGKMGCVKDADPPQVFEMEEVRKNHPYQIASEYVINGVKGFIPYYEHTYVNIFTGEEYEPTLNDEVKRVHSIETGN
ncbi:MAG: hypothetical protein HUJ98_11720 [Bacteroidaceae bacterium]|nr:hypothetical protein [Bacteroidaceae bacterium]